MTMSGSTVDFSDGGDQLLAFASEDELSNTCVAPLPESDRVLEVMERSPAEDCRHVGWYRRHQPAWQASGRAVTSAVARSVRRCQEWLFAARSLAVSVGERGSSIHRRLKLELYIVGATLIVMLKRRAVGAALVPFGYGVAVGALVVLFLSVRPEPVSPAGVGPALVGARFEQVAATASRPQTDSPRQLTTSGTPAAAPRAAAPKVTGYRGSLAVNSVPRGAQVFINNLPVGSTPLLLKDVPVGTRVVRLEMDGYRRWSSAVSVVANQRLDTKAALEPSPEP